MTDEIGPDDPLADLDSEARAIARQMLPSSYAELRAIAARCLAERGGAVTLQATALVHEAWLRLAGKSVALNDRVHFFALAVRIMRAVLVDHARRRRIASEVDPAVIAVTWSSNTRAVDVLDLDAALKELTARSPRQAQVVELRGFGGLEHAEIAALLGVSLPTVERDWRAGRAWLGARLSQGGDA